MEFLYWIVLNQPLEIIIIGMEYLNLRWIREQFFEIVLDFLVDSTKSINDKHPLHGRDLYQTDKRLTIRWVVLDIDTYQFFTF